MPLDASSRWSFRPREIYALAGISIKDSVVIHRRLAESMISRCFLSYPHTITRLISYVDSLLSFDSLFPFLC